MNAKWYRGYQIVGSREVYLERISNLVRQNDLGSTIPCLHIEKSQRRQWQFYLFLGFNTDEKGHVPSHISQILDSITIGHPVGDFDYTEIKSMTSAGIVTKKNLHNLTYRPSIFSTPFLNP